MAMDIVSFPIEHGDLNHTYVKLPEGTQDMQGQICFLPCPWISWKDHKITGKRWGSFMHFHS